MLVWLVQEITLNFAIYREQPAATNVPSTLVMMVH